jgi:hypothetical protein
MSDPDVTGTTLRPVVNGHARFVPAVAAGNHSKCDPHCCLDCRPAWSFWRPRGVLVVAILLDSDLFSRRKIYGVHSRAPRTRVAARSTLACLAYLAASASRG